MLEQLEPRDLLSATIQMATLELVKHQTYTGPIAHFSDAEAPQGPFTATVNFGDGQTAPGVVTESGDGTFAVAAEHAYSLAGTFTLSVIIDDGIAPSSASANLVVSFPPLTDETLDWLSAYEDEAITSAVVARFSTGDVDAANYAALIDWGDGATSVGSLIDDGGGHYRIAGDHTYGDWGYYLVTTTLNSGALEVGELYNVAEIEFHQYTHAYTDPVGNVTQFVYGEGWQLQREIDLLGNSTYYTYNSDGALASRTDRLGRSISFSYDTTGRVTSETWLLPDSTVADTLAFSYSSTGDLVSAGNAFGSYSFTWADARLASVTNPFNISMTFGYDSEGHRSSVTDPFGGVTGSTYVNGLLASRTFTDGTSLNLRVDLGYDAGGWLASISRFSDLAGTQLVATTEYVFANNALTSITHRDAVSNIIDSFDYSFNADYLLTSINSQSIGNTDYGYDADGQVISETSQVTTVSYGYDANGNRIGGGHLITPGNRLMSDGAWNYSYDAEGNLSKKVHASSSVAWKYSYDHRNQMVEARQFSEDPDYYGTAVLQLEADYKYDAFANRIEKAVDPDGAGPLATVITRYVLDGFSPGKPTPVGNENWDVIMELDGNNALAARYVHGDGVDQTFARIDVGAGSAGDAIQWYLTDHLNSVRAIVNNAGAVLDRIGYDAFGNVTMQINPTLGNHILFTSREFDAETGLYYSRARYLNPQTGTWTTQDPSGFGAGDSNLYRYVGNTPTIATDPSGNIVVESIVIGYVAYQYFRHGVSPLTLAAAAIEGAQDGALMVYNAATFHLDTQINAYVNNSVQQNGGGYGFANFMAHVGAYAAYASGLVYGWGAVGLPTYGVGVGSGPNGIHFIFGSTGYGGGAMTWMQGLGGGSGGLWIIGARSADVAATSFTLTGIPILFPTAAVGGSYAYNCLTAAGAGLRRGLIGF